MRTFKALFLSFFLITTFSFGKVVFNLNFADPQGVGFNAPENKEKMGKVREGAELLGKIIKQDAVVTLEVISDITIARAGSKACPDLTSALYMMLSYYTGSRLLSFLEIDLLLKGNEPVVMESINQILNGKSAWDKIGLIRFNIGNFSPEEIKIATIHEITHVLGFKHLFHIGLYGKFDQLLQDENNNSLVVEYTGGFGNGLKTNPNVNLSSDLYLCGSNIRKRNNGECLKVYNNQSELESSYSHLDTNAYPRNIMHPFITVDPYPIWNSYEIGVMEELGYEINWENYCEIVHSKNLTLTLFPAECFSSCANTNEIYK